MMNRRMFLKALASAPAVYMMPKALSAEPMWCGFDFGSEVVTSCSWRADKLCWMYYASAYDPFRNIWWDLAELHHDKDHFNLFEQRARALLANGVLKDKA